MPSQAKRSQVPLFNFVLVLPFSAASVIFILALFGTLLNFIAQVAEEITIKNYVR